MTRLEFLEAMKSRFAQLLRDNPGEPEDWSDAAKLRLTALTFDKWDADRKVYDRTGMQNDLRRMADRIEELGDAW